MAEELNFQGNSSDQLPPQNIEAEEAILGGILLDPEAMGRIRDRLLPQAFYVNAHREIYQAAIILNNQNKPTDLLSLTEWLTNNDKLSRIGGRNKLANLIDRTVSSVNIDVLADLVMDKYLRRQLIKAGNEIVKLGFEAQTELPIVLDQAEQKVFGITQEKPQEGLVHISDTLVHTFQEIETRHEGVALPGIPSGFYDLDAMTSGFQRSDLIIVAGRPSMGKCVSYDSEIVLTDGEIVTIEELYNRKGGMVLTLNPNWKFSFTQPCGFVNDGIKPVFRVTTALGRSIDTTITHPYLTPTGWQKLADLKPGAKIAVPAQINVFGKEKIDDGQLKIIAHCLGNGNMEKTIPPIVFKLGRSQIALFLNWLFISNIEHEGQIAIKEKLQTTYRTNQEKLARQIQHLLLRLGIIARLRKGYNKEQTTQTTWQLEITEPLSIQRFEIGVVAQTLEPIETQKDHDIYWDEIIAIENLGEKQVYDLTIPHTHNFIANDICVHNTAFCLNLAHNIAVGYKLPVAVFSLEMSKEQLVQRLLASEAQIETGYLRSGRISQTQWEPLSRAISLLSEMPVFIDDTPNITITQMRSQARKLQAQQNSKLGLIVIDYLQLMEGAGDNRVQELSKITRSLKGLARELSVPIIALSQLSRSVEARTNKRPMLSDLRESGSIEQDADLVIMLYREEYYAPDTPDRGIAEVIIAKHRNGPTGTVKLLFDPQFTKFKNLAKPKTY
ncbi:replicative DNA helicase [Cylindrospermopsis raciborskii]|uniref:Replicative DNA helicase n=2 Tax=Cylindrospermopsis raciborskii TaxID=77022 RepID=A0A853MFY3_9CYAN|nr:replicative DNA helicase [Cylindrospermopsis raciborskii]EFA70001.1 DnaB helicase [Cylindrospermopsis raciborskii CS-505]MBA4444792.1 replicative DNA helicase [Cylindrospermopsis raciborskii CS-506_C]MBA4449006.1 replicative DNA helicase [Cylindrospermopsis raciborskii CS-506_D]MBA4455640.1 replicative DNA helicase [Cylindrospermopsis raciborskii CS-506_B]MBA4464982.1 replicative DNA helicase [Cylindrospermopsis raciborskii CS-506_A]